MSKCGPMARFAAAVAPQKLSHGTSMLIASSRSPFAESAVSRLSAPKNPGCPVVRLRESCRQAADSHGSAGQAMFRGALDRVSDAVVSFRDERP